MEQSSQYHRLDYLDSARGIAAFMVLIGHYINWKYEHILAIKLASIVFNANDAVSFFFVLSGMVLSYPYLQYNKKLDIGKFYQSRFFRLYPAFWIAVLLNVVYVFRHQLNFDTFIDVFLLNSKQLWEELVLIRGANNFYLPGWTLTIEMAFSFFMPVIIFIGRHNRKLLLWLLLISFLMANNVSIFMFHFISGSLISCNIHYFREESFKKTFWYRYRAIILLAAVLLFSIRPLTRISPLGSSLMYFLDFCKIDFFTFTGVASFLFIIYLVHFKKAQRFFEHRILLFLGKISYGLYLSHWVFVRAIGDYWESHILPYFQNETKAFFVMLVLYVAVSLFAAVCLHYFVELPFMRLGKRLAKNMKPTIGV